MNTGKTRFEFLDVLRFLAATCVLFQHVLGSTQPWFRHISKFYFQPGIFGVTLFFLVSGFIIPVSLERNRSLKNFWINRIFRIYPLYLLSIFVTVLAQYISWHSYPPLKKILLQIIMVQNFTGGTNISGLYWTLSLEFLFYILLSAAFYFGFIKKSTIMAAIMLAISFFTAGILHISFGWRIIFYIATMFTGTLLYRLVEGAIKPKTVAIMLFAAITVFIANSLAMLYAHDPSSYDGSRNFWPVVSSTIAAYLVFIGFFMYRHKKYPRVFLYMGTISYSIYLVQGSVYGIIPQLSNPYLTIVWWVLLTILISMVTYTFVEKPFIRLSHKLTRVKMPANPVSDTLA